MSRERRDERYRKRENTRNPRLRKNRLKPAKTQTCEQNLKNVIFSVIYLFIIIKLNEMNCLIVFCIRQ